MAKTDPKLILGALAPTAPVQYPVQLPVRIEAGDRDNYNSITIDASRKWNEALIAAYLEKIGLTLLNWGSQFRGGFEPEDKAGVACASALLVVDEAQPMWSGRARGDVLILRVSYFNEEGKLRDTGVIKIIPTRGSASACPIDEVTAQKIEALEGRPVPRVKWTTPFKKWENWVNFSRG